MCSQANERAGKVLRPPIRALPSVIVDTELVLREVGKSDRPGVHLESPSGEPVRSPKNTNDHFKIARIAMDKQRTQYLLMPR